MIVAVLNQKKEILNGLDIEIVKKLEGEFIIEDIISTFSNFFYEKIILDITAIKDHNNFENLKKLSSYIETEKLILILEDNPVSDSREYLSKLISIGIYNFTKTTDGIKYLLENPNQYKNVSKYQILDSEINENEKTEIKSMESAKLKIIGVRNVTEHAGSTTLIYMMKKMLDCYYKVKCLEVDKNDFKYFKSEDMISTSSSELPKEFMKCQSSDVVLIDLNNYDDISVCSEVLYLIEPSILKLNKILDLKPNIMETLQNKKIILNRTNISNSDIQEFEYEGRINVFAKLKNEYDRDKVFPDVVNLLLKLGYSKVNGIDIIPEKEKKGLFDIFK